MGQVIDLAGNGETPVTRSTSFITHQVKLASDLRTQSSRQLLQSILEAQRLRVSTYKDYDRGLQAVLETRNLSYYTTVCAEATAAFSVVSDMMRAFGSELRERQKQHSRDASEDYAILLETLQQLEREKLQYTAALHLEKIRLNQCNFKDSTYGLMQESVTRLETKLSACIRRINDALEEIQCCIVDAPSGDGAEAEKK